jgi:hypothetical protein
LTGIIECKPDAARQDLGAKYDGEHDPQTAARLLWLLGCVGFGFGFGPAARLVYECGGSRCRAGFVGRRYLGCELLGC